MNLDERLNYLDSTLAAMESAWPRIVTEIQTEIDSLTLKLISSNDEQTRGAIKALLKLKDLPASLLYERDHIKAALSDEDAAT